MPREILGAPETSDHTRPLALFGPDNSAAPRDLAPSGALVVKISRKAVYAVKIELVAP